jgi:glycosyltransferase involved in cell wall biosynthesis
MLGRKIALIPAFEPGASLSGVAAKLVGSGFSVVIVDDGSGPDYAGRFQEARIFADVVSYMPNQGKGHAIKAGLEYIAANCARGSVIVTVDSDGQHTAEDADAVAARAAMEPDALTLGVRSFGDGTPARSAFGNSVTRTVYRLVTGVSVSDTQTGLRAFGVGLIPVFHEIAGERYEYEMNALIACPALGIAIREVPIRTIYMDNNSGSHFHTIRDSALVYSGVFTAAFRRLAARRRARAEQVAGVSGETGRTL